MKQEEDKFTGLPENAFRELKAGEVYNPLSLTCTAFLGQFTWQLRAVHPRQRFVIS